MYEEADFVHVGIVELKWPIAPWRADERLKEAGTFVMVSKLKNIIGVSLAVFTRMLGWGLKELEVYLVAVRREWKAKGIHAFCPVM